LLAVTQTAALRNIDTYRIRTHPSKKKAINGEEKLGDATGEEGTYTFTLSLAGGGTSRNRKCSPAGQAGCYNTKGPVFHTREESRPARSKTVPHAPILRIVSSVCKTTSETPPPRMAHRRINSQEERRTNRLTETSKVSLDTSTETSARSKDVVAREVNVKFLGRGRVVWRLGPATRRGRHW